MTYPVKIITNLVIVHNGSENSYNPSTKTRYNFFFYIFPSIQYADVSIQSVTPVSVFCIQAALLQLEVAELSPATCLVSNFNIHPVEFQIEVRSSSS